MKLVQKGWDITMVQKIVEKISYKGNNNNNNNNNNY